MAICVASPVLPGKWEKGLNQKLWFLRGRHFPPRTVSCPPGGCASSFKYLLVTSVWRGGRWAEVSSDERVMGDVRRARSSTCSPLALQGHPIPCVSVARCAPHIIWRRSVFTFFVQGFQRASVMYGVQTLSKKTCLQLPTLYLLMYHWRLRSQSTVLKCDNLSDQRHISTQENRPPLNISQFWMRDRVQGQHRNTCHFNVYNVRFILSELC